MTIKAPTYENHRFPVSIVARAVWCYFRFNLSLREVEEMMLERGVIVSYETIRRWCRKHASSYTRRIRRKLASPSDIWYLDEVVIRINGKKCWLGRAVDQDGYVLDEIVQTRRNTKAAKRLSIRLLKQQSIAPKRVITDKLRSYQAAIRQVIPHLEHRSHKGLNNRAENSHLPVRKRERTKQGFKSIGALQRFMSIFSMVRNLFATPHTIQSASDIRNHRRQAMATWNNTTLELV